MSPIFEFEPSAPTFSTVSGLSILLRHGCLGAEQKPAGQFFESRDVREDRINRMKRVPSDIYLGIDAPRFSRFSDLGTILRPEGAY